MNTTVNKTNRLTVSAVMLALATVLAMVCAIIPFLNLPFGGGFTVASMLPIVIIAYMYGVKWGFFVSFTYSVIQIILDLYLGKGGSTIMALFMPSSEDYMGIVAAISILVIDYIVAYTVLCLGGVFRNKIKNKTLAIVLGVILALGARYICHIVSGYIFYGAWAEWFFTQEGFYKIGSTILGAFEGKGLALIYSIFYNGLYMIPEIVITALAAVPVSRISNISKVDLK
ncbi:MAG: energy-coupled thiamine transporter ThiT [Clostridia bacterium]|nr:energy-coupled thiamine transporter ThiT [Clostridia bacterium]MBR6680150.1 energy-coupled thiamine transporter ThiT [Clostridia bacterium]